MNLQDNDFTLFGVPQKFAQDRHLLDARWKDLQRYAHPDQFSAQGVSAQRLAMQWSVRINQAYQCLKNPLKRAAYLCELRGTPIDAHTNTAMPSAFLIQQIEWREALDAVETAQDARLLQAQVHQQRQQRLAHCEALLDADPPAQQAVQTAAQEVRALMFIERFEHELEQQLDELEQ